MKTDKELSIEFLKESSELLVEYGKRVHHSYRSSRILDERAKLLVSNINEFLSILENDNSLT